MIASHNLIEALNPNPPLSCIVSLEVDTEDHNMHVVARSRRYTPLSALSGQRPDKWSEDENLLVVTKEGTLKCYYDLQGEFTQFSFGVVGNGSVILVWDDEVHGPGGVALGRRVQEVWNIDGLLTE